MKLDTIYRIAAAFGAICCLSWAVCGQGTAFAATVTQLAEEGTVVEETWQNNDGLLVPAGTMATTIEEDTVDDEIALRTATKFPDSYSLLDVSGISYVTSVKDQGSTGLCWAFASLGACESNVLLQNLTVNTDWLDEKGELNFSEAALATYPYTDHKIAGDFASGDSVSMENRGADGGNVAIASYALAAGMGTQLEQYAPIADWDEGYSEYQRYNSYYKMTSSDILWEAEEGYEKIVKTWLMESGAVVTNYYSKGKYYDNGTSSAYFQSTRTEDSADHAVLIVGWDDNYSKTNFQPGNQPSSDGAWLVRNSWGDDDTYAGYFWMSYEEASLCEFASFHMAENEENTTLYQYDGSVSYAGVLFSSAANVFTAESDGTLDTVMFPLTGHNSLTTYYNVSVYLLSEDAETPTDGTLCSTSSGTVKYGGYKSISLSTPVSLEQGQKFSVVLQLFEDKKRTTNAYLPMESSHEDASGLVRRSMISSGQSYLGSSDGDWVDVVELKSYTNRQGNQPYAQLGNVAIKAVVTESDTTVNWDQLEKALSYSTPTATSCSLYRTAFDVAIALPETASQTEVDNAAANLLAGLEKEGLLEYPTLYYANCTVTPGDVNQDGTVTTEDAYLTLVCYATESVGGFSTLTRTQVAAGDLDENGYLTTEDAYQILWKYASKSVGLLE
jgi:C1A family cysteine protease